MQFRAAKTWCLSSVMGFVLGPSMLIAEELPEHFIPVRANGIGGAFTAIANDEDAIWTNPAGVARIHKAWSRKGYFGTKFPNMSVGANGKSRDFYQGIQNSAEGGAEQVASQADQLGEKPFWAQASAFPMMMFRVGAPVAVGPYAHMQARGVIDEEAPDQARINVVTDVGGALAFAIADRSNRAQLGVGLRSIGRYSYEDTVPVAVLGDQTTMKARLKDDSNRSAAIGVDVGAMWTLADFWFPTIGAAVLNVPTSCKKDYLNPFSKKRETVCGTVFTGTFGNPDAVSTVDPTDIRVGVAITPRFGRDIAARLAIDAHHLHFASGDLNYGYSSVDPLKTLHAGLEVFLGNPLLPSPFSLSVGLNQGYYSMGASTTISFFSLKVASFGRDISSTSSPQEDRRYMGSLSFDF